MVGIVGIGVNAAALVFFTEVLGIHYVLSAILASQVSTLNNFILTELWVFRGRETRRNLLVRYLTFNALNIATLAIRVPVMWRARLTATAPKSSPGRRLRDPAHGADAVRCPRPSPRGPEPER